jgi:hypothetical protein
MLYSPVYIKVANVACFFLQNIQTKSGTHPPFYSMGTLGVNRLGRHADNSPPSSAEVMNDRSIILLHLYALVAWKGTNLLFYAYIISYTGRKDEEEDVSSYGMTLWKREDSVN